MLCFNGSQALSEKVVDMTAMNLCSDSLDVSDRKQ